MAEQSAPNFPDLLGFLTGGARAQVGVLQVALTVRPNPVQAGQPFEVIVVAQNAADSSVDLALAVQVPKRFNAAKSKLVVGLSAAEVGYVVLPVLAPADIAPGDYRVSVELNAKNPANPRRIRAENGGGALPRKVSDETRARVAALRGLTYVTARKLGRGSLDASFTVAGGRATTPAAPVAPGWFSLWTLNDIQDESVLAERFADLLRERTLPQLRRAGLVNPLAETTRARFEAAGYPLEACEAVLIAKLMTLILEYADPVRTGHGGLAAGRYDLSTLLDADRSEPEDAPRWFKVMLRAIARDERAAAHPIPLLTRTLYEPLLRDAIDLAFARVIQATGEDVGSSDEMEAYGDQLVEKLKTKDQLDFAHVYLPLVIGGVTVNDLIALSDENVVENLRQLWTVLDTRRAECDDDSLPIAEIAEAVIERALETYGHRRSSL